MRGVGAGHVQLLDRLVRPQQVAAVGLCARRPGAAVAADRLHEAGGDRLAAFVADGATDREEAVAALAQVDDELLLGRDRSGDHVAPTERIDEHVVHGLVQAHGERAVVAGRHRHQGLALAVAALQLDAGCRRPVGQQHAATQRDVLDLRERHGDVRRVASSHGHVAPHALELHVQANDRSAAGEAEVPCFVGQCVDAGLAFVGRAGDDDRSGHRRAVEAADHAFGDLRSERRCQQQGGDHCGVQRLTRVGVHVQSMCRNSLLANRAWQSPRSAASGALLLRAVASHCAACCRSPGEGALP
jgi:hypothetical protein